jgi:hypothetical protein
MGGRETERERRRNVEREIGREGGSEGDMLGGGWRKRRRGGRERVHEKCV